MKNGKKQIAQGLFVNQGWTAKAIAAQLGVTEKTIGRWKNDGNWDDLKEMQSITKSTLLQDAYRQLAAINKKIAEEYENVPSKELSDAKAVIRKEIEALSDNPLYLYVEVMEEMTDWVAKNHPKFLKDYSKLAYSFLEDTSKRK